MLHATNARLQMQRISAHFEILQKERWINFQFCLSHVSKMEIYVGVVGGIITPPLFSGNLEYLSRSKSHYVGAFQTCLKHLIP